MRGWWTTRDFVRVLTQCLRPKLFPEVLIEFWGAHERDVRVFSALVNQYLATRLALRSRTKGRARLRRHRTYLTGNSALSARIPQRSPLVQAQSPAHSGGFGQFCGSVTSDVSELGFLTY